MHLARAVLPAEQRCQFSKAQQTEQAPIKPVTVVTSRVVVGELVSPLPLTAELLQRTIRLHWVS
jgi:hypothetical protein